MAEGSGFKGSGLGVYALGFLLEYHSFRVLVFRVLSVVLCSCCGEQASRHKMYIDMCTCICMHVSIYLSIYHQPIHLSTYVSKMQEAR